MIKHKAYRYRIYPNEEQTVLITKTFGCARFVYNKMLEDKIKYYKENNLYLQNSYSQYVKLYPFLKEVDSRALLYAQRNLEQAFKNFFRNKSFGFPQFKRKKDKTQSYTTEYVNNNIRIEDDKFLRLPKVGLVSIKLSRKIPPDHRIISCTVTRTPTGSYYASLLTEYEEDIQPIDIDENKVIGLDMDMKNLFTDSEGKKVEYPKFYRSTQPKLVKAQRKLSKCVKGSKNYEKQRIKVAKIHEKIANQRKDFLHKLSFKLANEYDAVIIEDLNMQAMSQALNFGKSVSDNGWGMFTTFLKYKLEDRGKTLIKIDKWYPSSKTCHVCGYKYDDLTLSEREWTCPKCHTIHDRDVNAAINIKNEGLKIYFETKNREVHGDSSLILVGNNTALSEKSLFM